MILAEEKTRHHDRELQTDPSQEHTTWTYRRCEVVRNLRKWRVARKPFRELSCNSNIRTESGARR